MKPNVESAPMQPTRLLHQWLAEHANTSHCIFTFNDLRSLFPALTNAAFKTLLSRAVQGNILERVCRGVYCYKKTLPNDGLLLFHIAALLRANEFNYISLETVLSDTGVISQIPMNWITLMSSGRSNTISCGEFGSIEFVHTNQKAKSLVAQLSYDHQRGLWRANVALAIRDMKMTHRNTDLIDWDVANEFI